MGVSAVASWPSCGHPTPLSNRFGYVRGALSCCRAIRDGGALSDRSGPSSSRTVPHGVRHRHASRLEAMGDHLGPSRDEVAKLVLETPGDPWSNPAAPTSGIWWIARNGDRSRLDGGRNRTGGGLAALVPPLHDLDASSSRAEKPANAPEPAWIWR